MIKNIKNLKSQKNIIVVGFMIGNTVGIYLRTSQRLQLITVHNCCIIVLNFWLYYLDLNTIPTLVTFPININSLLL